MPSMIECIKGIEIKYQDRKNIPPGWVRYIQEPEVVEGLDVTGQVERYTEEEKVIKLNKDGSVRKPPGPQPGFKQKEKE